MSSTNRGGQRSPSDNYGTPPWVTHRLLERLELPPSGIWYEPCAGEGAIIEAAKLYGSPQWRHWWANELRPEAELILSKHVQGGHLTIGDILDPSTPLPPAGDVSVVITNPPYRLAWELLHKMLQEFPKAHVVFLLRVNFIASQRRYGFMSQYMPDLYVLPNRPGFRGWGETDSPEYGWFHFFPSPRARTRGNVELLRLTAKEERKKVPKAPIIYPDNRVGD